MTNISSKLTSSPGSKYINDQNKWADYIELLCLLSTSGKINADELKNRLSDQAVGNAAGALKEQDNTEVNQEIETAEDKLDAKIRERFEFISQRAIQFGDKYPFTFDPRTITLNSKQITDDIYQPYLFYLLASNLDYSREELHNLTNVFEQLSLSVSATMFKQQFKTLHFGTARPAGSEFQGNGLERLTQLANQLHLNLRTDIDNNAAISNTHGDFGIDIVCYQEWGDNQSNAGLIFIQCGCGQDWVDKQLEAHSINQEKYFQFRNKPATALFIPHSFRDALNKWAYPTSLSDIIIIDRWRLLNLEITYSAADIVKMRGLIDTLLQEKMGYFD